MEKKKRTLRLIIAAYLALWALRVRKWKLAVGMSITNRLVKLYKKHNQIKELALNNRKIITLIQLKIPVEFRFVRGLEMLRTGTMSFVAMLEAQKAKDPVKAELEAEKFLHASRLLLCECAVKPRIIRSSCAINPGEINIDDLSDEEVGDAASQLYESSNIRYYGRPERPQDKALSIADIQRMQEVAVLFDQTLKRYGGLDPEKFLDTPMNLISQITDMMDTARSAEAEAAEKAKFRNKKKK